MDHIDPVLMEDSMEDYIDPVLLEDSLKDHRDLVLLGIPNVSWSLAHLL